MSCCVCVTNRRGSVSGCVEVIPHLVARSQDQTIRFSQILLYKSHTDGLILFAGSHSRSWSIQLPNSYIPPLLLYHQLHHYLTIYSIPVHLNFQSTSIPSHDRTASQTLHSNPRSGVRSLPLSARFPRIPTQSKQANMRASKPQHPLADSHQLNTLIILAMGVRPPRLKHKSAFFQHMLAFRRTPERATCASKTSWVEFGRRRLSPF